MPSPGGGGATEGGIPSNVTDEEVRFKLRCYFNGVVIIYCVSTGIAPNADIL